MDKFSPSYKEIFFVILDHCVFKPTKFDDHGVIIDLLPGQICISERELLKHCSPYISRIEIQRCIRKLTLCNFLSQKVSHRKSVLTITHKDTYELILRATEPRNEPNLSQTCAKLEPQSNNVNNTNNVNKRNRLKKIFLSDSIEYGLSIFLFESLVKIIPDFIKPDLQKWSYEFDKMIRLENRPPEKIKENILSITIGTSWWVGKVHSPEGLRTNWYKISSQVQGKPIQAMEQEPRFKGKNVLSIKGES